MSMLYLIRHGQASAGTHDYDRLSPVGRHQAQLLGQWWTEQGFTPDKTFHGSLLRQQDTAKLAMSAIDPDHQSTEHAGLNEYDHRVIDSVFGAGAISDDAESMTFEQYAETMQRWKNGQTHERSGEAEPWSEFAGRGWQTVSNFHKSSNDAQNLAFFTSGGVIATLLSTVLNLDFTHTIDIIWRIRNASITTLHYDGQQARLVDFNTVPHLQEQKDPSLITLI